MTLPKSRNERIRRKLRVLKKPVSTKNNNIVIKKHANTDPERKHKYARSQLAKEFIEFYKTGKSDNPNKFKFILENLINLSVENGGNLNLPYSLSKIQELSCLINEADEANEADENISIDFNIEGKK